MQTVSAPPPMTDEQYIRKLEAENAALRERVKELEAEIADLKQDRTTGGVKPFTVSS